MSPKLFIVVNVDWFFLSHHKGIALAAMRSGYDVTIVTKNTGKKDEILRLGLRMIDLPINRSGKNILEETRTCSFLSRLYKVEKPNVVHHVGLKLILWGTLAARITKVQGIVNAVSGLGILFVSQKRSIMSIGLIYLLRLLHNHKNLFVIFQNEDDKAFFLQYHIVRNEQIMMIKGSGVDLVQYQYVKEPTDGIITQLKCIPVECMVLLFL
jgi:hypothetical protein